MLNERRPITIPNPNARRGVMLILSSPSGAGKTTLANMLIAEDPALQFSVSATTRPIRPGEIDGKHYFFIDRPAFESRRDSGEFLEWAEVWGNLYGTPKAPVEAALGAGHDVVFDIDWQGAQQITRAAPADVAGVFILPPSREIQKQRLTARATDSVGSVAQRLAGAAEEISHWGEYDYVIINDDLDASLHALRCILYAERHKRERCLGLALFVDGLLRDA